MRLAEISIHESKHSKPCAVASDLAPRVSEEKIDMTRYLPSPGPRLGPFFWNENVQQAVTRKPFTLRADM